MPRKIPQEQQEEWIALADQGLNAWEIRKRLKVKSDVRTIENIINRAKGERASDDVRSQARTQALVAHWKQLADSTSALDALGNGIPRSLGGKRPAYALGEVTLNGQGWKASKGQFGWEAQLEYQESMEGRLLKEHTGHDSFWKAVDGYRSALAGFIDARLNLARTVKTSLNATLASKEDGDGGMLADSGTALCDEAVFATATGAVDRMKDLEASLKLVLGAERIEADGTLIAASKGKFSASTLTAAVQALEGIRGSCEWKAVIAAHSRLSRAADELSDEALLARTMPALPGTCRACARIA
jgi:hypothetical protein